MQTTSLLCSCYRAHADEPRGSKPASYEHGERGEEGVGGLANQNNNKNTPAEESTKG
jgi:hypothetical protein